MAPPSATDGGRSVIETASYGALVLIALAWAGVLLAGRRGAPRTARDAHAREAGGPSSGAAAASHTTPRPPRGTYRRFEAASSLLDTHGGIVRSWDDAPAPHAQPAIPQDSSGWLNLALVVLGAHLLSNAYHYGPDPASFLMGSGRWFAASLIAAPQYFRDTAVLGLAFAVPTFVWQALLSRGCRALRPRAVQYVAQAAGECALFFGGLAYTRSRADWPLLQRLGFAMQVRDHASVAAAWGRVAHGRARMFGAEATCLTRLTGMLARLRLVPFTLTPRQAVDAMSPLSTSTVPHSGRRADDEAALVPRRQPPPRG